MYSEHDDFLVILEDQCYDYHIVTSINGLVYRVEVYRNSELEDAMEIECNELRMSPESEILFSSQYTKAHHEYVKRFCKKDLEEEKKVLKENNLSDNESVKETINKRDDNNILESQNKLKYMWNILKGSNRILQITISIVVITFFIFIGRIVLCNETFIGFFFDKRSFYEKTESFCHKLEKECITLSQTNLEQNTIISPKDCRDWCKNKIITKNRCALFLPYFPEDIRHEDKVKPVETESKLVKRDTPKKTERKSLYTFTPEGILVLHLNSDLKLNITNKALKTFVIKLKRVELNESEYEEIVQFRSGLTTFRLEAGEKKQFKIFLEPTYYEQFKKGEYHGKFIFALQFDEDNKKELIKDFMFRVK